MVDLAAQVEASMGRVVHITPHSTAGGAACGMPQRTRRERGDWASNSWEPGVTEMTCASLGERTVVLPVCPSCVALLPNHRVGA